MRELQGSIYFDFTRARPMTRWGGWDWLFLDDMIKGELGDRDEKCSLGNGSTSGVEFIIDDSHPIDSFTMRRSRKIENSLSKEERTKETSSEA